MEPGDQPVILPSESVTSSSAHYQRRYVRLLLAFLGVVLAGVLLLMCMFTLGYAVKKPESPISLSTTSPVATDALSTINTPGVVKRATTSLTTRSLHDGTSTTTNTIASQLPTLATLQSSYPAVFKNTNSNSFIALNEDYGKDANHVYWLAEGDPGPMPHVVAGADPKTFKVFSESTTSTSSDIRILYSSFGKDKNNLYQNGYTFDIASVDPATFVPLPGAPYNGYFKDKNHVYLTLCNGHCHRIVPNADPATFKVLPHQQSANFYGVDKNRAYFSTTTIPVADPASLQVIPDENDELGGALAKDKNNVFLGARPLNLNPNTFSVIYSSSSVGPVVYLKDDRSVYVATPVQISGEVPVIKRVNGADPVTFTAASSTSYDAYDKKQTYVAGYPGYLAATSTDLHSSLQSDYKNAANSFKCIAQLPQATTTITNGSDTLVVTPKSTIVKGAVPVSYPNSTSTS